MNPEQWLAQYARQQAVEWQVEAERLLADYEYAAQQVAYWSTEEKRYAAEEDCGQMAGGE